MREVAVKAADEEDVRERLAVEAFLGAIPWHFTKEIRMKKIENLEEALEEAKTRRAIEEEEEGRKKKAHAAAEEGEVARQGQNMDPRRKRRPRCDPICCGCGEQGHVLRECPLWQEFRKDRRRRRREANVRRSEDAVMKEAFKLERGPLGTRVGDNSFLSIPIQFQFDAKCELVNSNSIQFI